MVWKCGLCILFVIKAILSNCSATNSSISEINVGKFNSLTAENSRIISYAEDPASILQSIQVKTTADVQPSSTPSIELSSINESYATITANRMNTSSFAEVASVVSNVNNVSHIKTIINVSDSTNPMVSIPTLASFINESNTTITVTPDARISSFNSSTAAQPSFLLPPSVDSQHNITTENLILQTNTESFSTQLIQSSYNTHNVSAVSVGSGAHSSTEIHDEISISNNIHTRLPQWATSTYQPNIHNATQSVNLLITPTTSIFIDSQFISNEIQSSLINVIDTPSISILSSIFDVSHNFINTYTAIHTDSQIISKNTLIDATLQRSSVTLELSTQLQSLSPSTSTVKDSTLATSSIMKSFADTSLRYVNVTTAFQSNPSSTEMKSTFESRIPTSKPIISSTYSAFVDFIIVSTYEPCWITYYASNASTVQQSSATYSTYVSQSIGASSSVQAEDITIDTVLSKTMSSVSVPITLLSISKEISSVNYTNSLFVSTSFPIVSSKEIFPTPSIPNSTSIDNVISANVSYESPSMYTNSHSIIPSLTRDASSERLTIPLESSSISQLESTLTSPVVIEGETPQLLSVKPITSILDSNDSRSTFVTPITTLASAVDSNHHGKSLLITGDLLNTALPSEALSTKSMYSSVVSLSNSDVSLNSVSTFISSGIDFPHSIGNSITLSIISSNADLILPVSSAATSVDSFQRKRRDVVDGSLQISQSVSTNAQTNTTQSNPISSVSVPAVPEFPTVLETVSHQKQSSQIHNISSAISLATNDASETVSNATLPSSSFHVPAFPVFSMSSVFVSQRSSRLILMNTPIPTVTPSAWFFNSQDSVSSNTETFSVPTVTILSSPEKILSSDYSNIISASPSSTASDSSLINLTQVSNIGTSASSASYIDSPMHSFTEPLSVFSTVDIINVISTSVSTTQVTLNTTSEHISSMATQITLDTSSKQISSVATRLILNTTPEHISSVASQITLNTVSTHISSVSSQITLNTTSKHIDSLASQITLNTPSEHISSVASKKTLNTTSKHISSVVSQIALNTTSKHITSIASQITLNTTSKHISSVASHSTISKDNNSSTHLASMFEYATTYTPESQSRANTAMFTSMASEILVSNVQPTVSIVNSTLVQNSVTISATPPLSTIVFLYSQSMSVDLNVSSSLSTSDNSNKSIATSYAASIETNSVLSITDTIKPMTSNVQSVSNISSPSPRNSDTSSYSSDVSTAVISESDFAMNSHSTARTISMHLPIASTPSITSLESFSTVPQTDTSKMTISSLAIPTQSVGIISSLGLCLVVKTMQLNTIRSSFYEKQNKTNTQVVSSFEIHKSLSPSSSSSIYPIISAVNMSDTISSMLSHSTPANSTFSYIIPYNATIPSLFIHTSLSTLNSSAPISTAILMASMSDLIANVSVSTSRVGVISNSVLLQSSMISASPSSPIVGSMSSTASVAITEDGTLDVILIVDNTVDVANPSFVNNIEFKLANTYNSVVNIRKRRDVTDGNVTVSVTGISRQLPSDAVRVVFNVKENNITVPALFAEAAFHRLSLSGLQIKLGYQVSRHVRALVQTTELPPGANEILGMVVADTPDFNLSIASNLNLFSQKMESYYKILSETSQSVTLQMIFFRREAPAIVYLELNLSIAGVVQNSSTVAMLFATQSLAAISGDVSIQVITRPYALNDVIATTSNYVFLRINTNTTIVNASDPIYQRNLTLQLESMYRTAKELPSTVSKRRRRAIGSVVPTLVSVTSINNAADIVFYLADSGVVLNAAALVSILNRLSPAAMGAILNSQIEIAPRPFILPPGAVAVTKDSQLWIIAAVLAPIALALIFIGLIYWRWTRGGPQRKIMPEEIKMIEQRQARNKKADIERNPNIAFSAQDSFKQKKEPQRKTLSSQQERNIFERTGDDLRQSMRKKVKVPSTYPRSQVSYPPSRQYNDGIQETDFGGRGQAATIHKAPKPIPRDYKHRNDEPSVSKATKNIIHEPLVQSNTRAHEEQSPKREHRVEILQNDSEEDDTDRPIIKPVVRYMDNEIQPISHVNELKTIQTVPPVRFRSKVKPKSILDQSLPPLNPQVTSLVTPAELFSIDKDDEPRTDLDPDLKQKADVERQRNKERLRSQLHGTKKLSARLPLTTEQWKRSQAQFNAALDPPTGTPINPYKSPKSHKRRRIRRRNKIDITPSSNVNNGIRQSLAPPIKYAPYSSVGSPQLSSTLEDEAADSDDSEISMEEARNRMHALLDDAFTLLQPLAKKLPSSNDTTRSSDDQISHSSQQQSLTAPKPAPTSKSYSPDKTPNGNPPYVPYGYNSFMRHPGMPPVGGREPVAVWDPIERQKYMNGKPGLNPIYASSPASFPYAFDPSRGQNVFITPVQQQPDGMGGYVWSPYAVDHTTPNQRNTKPTPIRPTVPSPISKFNSSLPNSLISAPPIGEPRYSSIDTLNTSLGGKSSQPLIKAIKEELLRLSQTPNQNNKIEEIKPT